MHRGYIKLWRKMQDNFLWKEPRRFSRAEAWIDMIMEAQHHEKPQRVVIGNSILFCNRSESLKSLETWSARWNWSKSATRRFLNLLKKTGQIETQSETVTTRIKIIKYDTYCPLRNTDGTELNSVRNASETQVAPDNNVNNVNNINTSPAHADILEKIDAISELLYQQKRFPKVHAFKNKILKQKQNANALYHALKRLELTPKIGPESAWAYCAKIMQVENGNYNEAEYIERVQKQKQDLQNWEDINAGLSSG